MKKITKTLPDSDTWWLKRWMEEGNNRRPLVVRRWRCVVGNVSLQSENIFNTFENVSRSSKFREHRTNLFSQDPLTRRNHFTIFHEFGYWSRNRRIKWKKRYLSEIDSPKLEHTFLRTLNHKIVNRYSANNAPESP